MSKRIVLLSSATLVCVALGWLIGTFDRPLQTPEPLPSLASPNEAALTEAAPAVENVHSLNERLTKAFAEIKTIPSMGEQTVAACRLIAHLPTEHLPAAVEVLGAGAMLMHREFAIQEWAARDFEAARAWMVALPAQARQRATGSIGREWAKRDPASLLAWVKSFDGAERAEVLAMLGPSTVGLMAGNDLDGGLQFLREGKSNASQEMELVKSFARRMPAAAAARILDHPSGSSRSEALSIVMEEWARQNPAEARVFWQGLSDAALAQSVAPSLLKGWGDKDPKGAIEFLADLPATKENLASVPALLGSWSDRDPEAALAWLDQQPEGSLGYDAYSAVLSKLDKDDPEAAMRRMEAREAAGKPISKGAYAEALRDLAYRDSPETAFQRLETLQKLGIANAYASVLASRFPERVTEWALQQPPENRGDLFWRIAYQLRSDGGGKAVDFAMKLPVDEGTSSIIREMAFEHLLSHTTEVLPLYARILPEEEAHRLRKRHAYAWLHAVSLSASERAKRWLAETPIFTEDEKQALSTPPSSR